VTSPVNLGFTVEGGHLKVSKIGAVKIKLHRPIDGTNQDAAVRLSQTAHAHVPNQRADAHHKLARILVNG